MGVTAALIVGGAAVASAGIGAYSSSQASKAQRSNSELGQLGYQDQLAQAGLYADQQFELNRRNAMLGLELGPLYGMQQRAQTDQMVKQLLKLYPGFAAAESAATSKSRTKDLADFQKNAPGWYDSLMETSPAYAAIGTEVNNGAGSPLLDYLNMSALTAGHSPLRDELEKQALAELKLGGQISPEAARLGEQQVRQSWSDRGLLYSNPAVSAELLNRDYLSQARLRDRQQFGALAQGIGQNEDTANRNFGIGVQGANEASQGNWRNFLQGASQAQLSPILSAGMQRTPVNPLGMFGLAGMGAQPQQMAMQAVGAPPSIYQGVQALTPLYNYAQDVNNTNFNANAAARIGQQNNTAAVIGGVGQLAGSLYGNYMKGSTGTIPRATYVSPGTSSLYA